MKCAFFSILSLSFLVGVSGCAKEESPPVASDPAPAPTAVADSSPDLAEPVADQADPDEAEVASKDVPELADHFRNVFVVDGNYYAGIPTEEGLRTLAERGVTLVISLLTEEQQERMVAFDEPGMLAEMGVRFEQIPISTAEYSSTQVDRFAELIADQDEPFLLHCGSSNRVGALWASYLNRHRGIEVDEAIEIGRSVGLRSDALVEAIRRVADTD